MNTYYDLINDKKFAEAEVMRKAMIPKKLIKFISLDENKKMNGMKLDTLKNEQLWFSSIQALNDPYEFMCMYVDENRLKKEKCPDWLISIFKNLIENLKTCGVVSLSSNSYDCLPMWAYYTNNYKGFCVEYDVIKPDALYKVDYEAERIPIAGIISKLYLEFQKSKECGDNNSEESKFYSTMVTQQFFLKHKSWSHENEYRVVLPLSNEIGRNESIAKLGLKTSRIIAGLKCEKENIERLNVISNDLRCGDVKQIKISENSYTFMEEHMNG